MDAAVADRPKYKPFLNSGALFQIGLRPMAEGTWLDIGDDHAGFMAAKRRRLASEPGTFYRSLPVSLDPQRELLGLVAIDLAANHAESFAMKDGWLHDLIDGSSHELSPAGEPLWTLGNMIEEDFVILQTIDGRDVITAASNAYTSSGRIVASVGNVMPWAHQHVPALNDQLGGRIDRILANIKPGAPVERFNWLLTHIADRLFPENPHAANAAASDEIGRRLEREPERAGDELWVRIERQTLHRLPDTGALAFSIHTYSHPLSALASDTESLRAMHALIASYSHERLRYSAMAQIKAPVLAWLARRF